jgi:hypothetical protein
MKKQIWFEGKSMYGMNQFSYRNKWGILFHFQSDENKKDAMKGAIKFFLERENIKE